MSNKKKIREVQGRRDASHGEQSPYWDDYNRRRAPSGQDELPQANPDVLPEVVLSGPSTPQLIMGEAVAHLQGRQKEVYLLSMREDKSLAEIGEVLGMTKSSAQVYQRRAIKFIEQYCKAAIAKGRV